MENFIFQNTTKIIFGKGTENEVGNEIKQYGKKVLLTYTGETFYKESGLYDRVVNSLRNAGLEFIELTGIKPNPRLSLVREGIKICREKGVDCILAVGGGSTIDTSKAIAVGVYYEGDVWDFYSGKALPQKTLPVGVILTIAATGSETSNSSVITNEDGWYKCGLNDIITRPKFAIMNPELTYTLPPFQTASGAVDIMTHVMERYFTNIKNVELTDRLCEATLKTIINNAPIVLKQPKNYEARAEIMWSGTIAHNDLLHTGRIPDWASHIIEHELGGIYDVAHGAGLAVIFPAWMKYVYKHDIERFTQFAVRVWNIDYSCDSPERTALEGIEAMTAFFKKIGMPTTLKELGIEDDRFEEMAIKATNSGANTVGGFVPLKKEDIINIFKLAR